MRIFQAGDRVRFNERNQDMVGKEAEFLGNLSDGWAKLNVNGLEYHAESRALDYIAPADAQKEASPRFKVGDVVFFTADINGRVPMTVTNRQLSGEQVLVAWLDPAMQVQTFMAHQDAFVPKPDRRVAYREDLTEVRRRTGDREIW